MSSLNITVRYAKLTDAQAISELINGYARKGIMLYKPLDTVIEGIRNFFVAENESGLIGCCAVAFFTEELAEIRSIAVQEEYQKHGVGKLLVEKAEEILKYEGIKSVFALTYQEAFFERLGYHKVDKTKFPQKIWRDCLACSKIMQCDEIAMEKNIV